MRIHVNSSEMVVKSSKCPKRIRPPPKRPQHLVLYRCLKRRLGYSLRARQYQQLVAYSRIKTAHQPSGTKNGIPSTEAFPISVPTSVDSCSHRQDYSRGLHKQRGTHPAEVCAVLWQIMSWCHPHHISIRASIPGCLSLIADSLLRAPRSNLWSGSYIHRFSNDYGKGGSHHIWTCLQHNSIASPPPPPFPYVSPIPDQEAWGVDALNLS